MSKRRSPDKPPARYKSKPLTTEQKLALYAAYTAPPGPIGSPTQSRPTMADLAGIYGVSISVIFRAVHDGRALAAAQ